VLLVGGCAALIALLVLLSSGAPAERVSERSLTAPRAAELSTPAAPAPAVRKVVTPTAAAPPAAARAAKLWEERGCIACHDLEQQAMGPPIRGAWGSRRKLEGGREAVVDEAYIRKSIKEPSADIVEGYPDQMQPQELTEEEIGVIISLYKSMAAAPGAAGSAPTH
jgi:cytochrome c oxidase subunit 2